MDETSQINMPRIKHFPIVDDGLQPNKGGPELYYEAIDRSPTGSLTGSEICKYLSDTYSFFRENPEWLEHITQTLGRYRSMGLLIKAPGQGDTINDDTLWRITNPPKVTWTSLIIQAIHNSPEHRATYRQVHDWIFREYPCFKQYDEKVVTKQIRRALRSRNKSFVKVWEDDVEWYSAAKTTIRVQYVLLSLFGSS